ncbi:AAA family ATPase [Azospirillum sp. YIM DDC1]|uniref:AAA family ATPase n=1 Tax=Azospirillum aestuarii TaxID=2802052 RepID=A0ABS1I7J3_9PROT|nr:AAA family ATPase [Azospirillum aestuarii]MBK4723036.1 AAA family ATPase [Azospirillum aestuarii]
MNSAFRSEIRHSQIRDLLGKVREKRYGQYLYSIKMHLVRSFKSENPEPITFEFPVTALIGTNGGGKSTILGAAACAYKNIKPRDFFPKSAVGDNSMANWHISYDIINKDIEPRGLIPKSARFHNYKWRREEFFDRNVVYFGISRTVPTGEKTEFKKIARSSFVGNVELNELSEIIRSKVGNILGKSVTGFRIAKIDGDIELYIGKRDDSEYSEFHFGAGESSIIRMVAKVETVPENSLILIEEIENGLHPVATTRMVEYLIDAAERRKVQIIFTTHSEHALKPLPTEAVWAAIEGKLQKGRMSIEALRTFSGEVPERVVVVVEDPFARSWCLAILRAKARDRIGEIGVYEVSGDGNAVKIHSGHLSSPAVRFKSVCIIDGDSEQVENENEGIFRLPGGMPESTIYNYIAENIDRLAPRVTVACHQDIGQQDRVVDTVKRIHATNRDAHVIFSQLGIELGWVPEEVVVNGLLSIWISEHPEETNRIAEAILALLPSNNEVRGLE